MSQKSYTVRNTWCNHSIRFIIFGSLWPRHGFRSQIFPPRVNCGYFTFADCIRTHCSLEFTSLFRSKEVAVHGTKSSKQKWALILGASSGFGAAVSVALARGGYHILGVHLDRRATLHNAERVTAEIRSSGCQALFYNANAADPSRRAEIIAHFLKEISAVHGDVGIDILLHSLAFGTLKPYICDDRDGAIKPADMNMTLDVMAHSLVYWVQELFSAGLLKRGAKIFALTSAGGHRVWQSYGAVSAAKAALESHVRQLAVELAPHGISANALRAGVTDTPAARKIPGSDRMFALARENNPGKRLTSPADIADALVAMASCHSTWMTGNVIGVDGGEDLLG
jgi:enoyl-[acyl-carrier protein] reductase III